MIGSDDGLRVIYNGSNVWLCVRVAERKGGSDGGISDVVIQGTFLGYVVAHSAGSSDVCKRMERVKEEFITRIYSRAKEATMYSKHRNTDVPANTRAGKLDPYYSRNDEGLVGGPVAALILIAIGVVLGIPAGAGLSAGLRAYYKPVQHDCQMCHVAPAVKSLADYRKVHPSPAELRRAKADKGLRADLRAARPRHDHTEMPTMPRNHQSPAKR